VTSYSAPPEVYYDDEIDLREIVEIIRKRIKLIIILPLLAAIAAFGVTKFLIIPKFEASAKIALGTFEHDILSDVTASREVLLSRNLLSQVHRDLGLQELYPSVEDFVEKVSVGTVANTKMLTITYRDSDPQRAQRVVESIVAGFTERSETAYTQAKDLLIQRIAELEASYEHAELTYRNSLSTLETLESLESQDAETALARAGIIIDYLARGEERLLSISAALHEAKVELSGLENVRVVEEPLVGADPINIRPVFNTAIAIVLGGMVALGLVFILEYFEKNPLQS
jgi:capsular polysaccharide biosynthesis protein